VLFCELLERVLDLLANDQQFALERILIGAVVAPRDNRLLDNRHRIDHRFAQSIERCRNIPPADKVLPFFGSEAFKSLSHKLAGCLVLRHKTHGDAIITRLRELVPVLVGPPAEQRIRDLKQNSGAIAKQRISANRPAVIYAVQNFERLLDNCVRLFPFDMRNHAHATGVVFVGRVVETLGGGVSHVKIHPVRCQSLTWSAATSAAQGIGRVSRD